MSPILICIRATMLERLADGDLVEAGEGQTTDPYPPDIAQAIGPMVASLRRAGLIDYAGARCATRPTRRRTVARVWRAVDREACRRLAAEDRCWLKAHPVAEPSRRARQMTLPGLD